MLQEKMGVTGKVTARVLTYSPKAIDRLAALRHSVRSLDRQHEKIVLSDFRAAEFVGGGLIQKLRADGSPMISVSRNLVVDDGDDNIADLHRNAPTQTKFDSTNAHIAVGTGFVSVTKATTALVTPTGSPEIMDATFPITKGAYQAVDGNVIQFRATFEAGDLNITDIDEAVLINAATEAGGETMTYAQITPAVNVTTADTLEVTWELTFLGA